MRHIASCTPFFSLLTIAAAMAAAPVQANSFNDPDSGVSHNIGSAPNPSTTDVVSVYPLMSEKRGEQGEVLLKLWLSGNGSVTHAVVAKSSGFTRLDEAALQYVKAPWSFQPAEGQEMPVDTELNVRFVLR